MQIDWLKYSIEQIKTGTDANGDRLLIAFNKDYKAIFGNEPCHHCNGWPEKVKNFLNHIKTMSKVENSGYRLKNKYEGISLTFGGDPISNANLTDEIAKRLLKNHPAGENLFSQIPEEKPKSNNKDNGDVFKGMKKKDLEEWATKLEIDATGNVNELKARISEKLKERQNPAENQGGGNPQ